MELLLKENSCVQPCFIHYPYVRFQLIYGLYYTRESALRALQRATFNSAKFMAICPQLISCLTSRLKADNKVAIASNFRVQDYVRIHAHVRPSRRSSPAFSSNFLIKLITCQHYVARVRFVAILLKRLKRLCCLPTIARTEKRNSYPHQSPSWPRSHFVVVAVGPKRVFRSVFFFVGSVFLSSTVSPLSLLCPFSLFNGVSLRPIPHTSHSLHIRLANRKK